MYIKKKKNIRLIELDRPTKEYSSFLEKLMIWNEFALRSRIEEYTVFLEKSIIRNEFTFYSKMKEYSCFLRWFGMNLHFVREWNNIRVSWEIDDSKWVCASFKSERIFVDSWKVDHSKWVYILFDNERIFVFLEKYGMKCILKKKKIFVWSS